MGWIGPTKKPRARTAALSAAPVVRSRAIAADAATVPTNAADAAAEYLFVASTVYPNARLPARMQTWKAHPRTATRFCCAAGRAGAATNRVSPS